MDKKKAREKKVKQKLLKQRQLMQVKKKERFTYLEHVKKTPKVKKGDSALVRNNKVLQRMMAEHEAFVEFQKEHKHTADEVYDNAQINQAKIIAEMSDEG